MRARVRLDDTRPDHARSHLRRVECDRRLGVLGTDLCARRKKLTTDSCVLCTIGQTLSACWRGEVYATDDDFKDCAEIESMKVDS